MKRMIVALAALMFVSIAAEGKKKSVEELDIEVTQLTQKVDSLEKIISNQEKLILSQKASISESISDLYRSFAELKRSYEALQQQMGQMKEVAGNNSPKIEIKGDLCCGLAVAKMGLKYGYVNADGQPVIEPQFEEAEDFVSDCAIVKKNNKWGVVDTAGNIVVPCQYEVLYRWGGINNSIFTCKCENGLFGVVSTKGVIQECEYEDISVWSDGKVTFRKNGKNGRFDANGQVEKK